MISQTTFQSSYWNLHKTPPHSFPPSSISWRTSRIIKWWLLVLSRKVYWKFGLNKPSTNEVMALEETGRISLFQCSSLWAFQLLFRNLKFNANENETMILSCFPSIHGAEEQKIAGEKFHSNCLPYAFLFESETMKQGKAFCVNFWLFHVSQKLWINFHSSCGVFHLPSASAIDFQFSFFVDARNREREMERDREEKRKEWEGEIKG